MAWLVKAKKYLFEILQVLMATLQPFFKKYLTCKLVSLVIGVTSLILLIVIFASYFLVHHEASTYIYTSISDLPDAQAVLIPGAAILPDGVLSPVLKDRVDTAIEVYRAGKVSKILVTGDNSTLAYNEVNPVRLYLLEKEVPDEDIFLDHAGFNTYSSMYRARDVFLVESMIIVTQSFHLSRAVYTAKHLGFTAFGISADQGQYLQSNYTRELFANVKLMIDLLFHTQPKFLGDEIPITGGGTI